MIIRYKHILVFGILCLTLASNVLQAQPDEKKLIDKVVAVVGERLILRSQLEQQYTQYARSGMEVDENTHCVLFEELLFQNLLVHKALKDSLEVSDDEVEGEINRRLDYFVNQIGSIERLEQFYGKSINEIRREFSDEIRDQLLMQQAQGKITMDVKVSPKDVREFYNKIPTDSLPYINSEVEVAHIVIEPIVSDEEKERIKERLRGFKTRVEKGEDFGTLAYLYSEDPGSAKKNGELGFMTRGMLVPEFAAAAFSLSPGQMSDIIETEYGFHIIQAISIRGQEMNARHILLKPNILPQDLSYTKSTLDSIRKRILENDSISFESLAARHSNDKDSKQNGGKMVNPQTGNAKFEVDMLNQVDPGLFFVLDKMKVNEISEPVVYQKRDGSKAYRIVKLLKITEPHRANLKDDYQRIQAAAKAEKEKRILDEWIQDRIKETYIRIDESFQSCIYQHNWF